MKAFFLISPLVLATALALSMAETSAGLENVGSRLRFITSVLVVLGTALTVYSIWRMGALDAETESPQEPVPDDENLAKE